jgi:hypothetical protein
MLLSVGIVVKVLWSVCVPMMLLILTLMTIRLVLLSLFMGVMAVAFLRISD